MHYKYKKEGVSWTYDTPSFFYVSIRFSADWLSAGIIGS